MSEDKSKTIIPKRATKTKLASSESVLKEGEIALIYPDTGPGTGAAKLVSGDGTTVAKNLPIAIDGEAIDELRESLDIAKKIIPITLSLTGWESINGDNSAPYVQTVINEELKASMNPDLVSMLDESATTEEQETYNKNLAIISQGVGTVNDGSITYKVYKLPSADITIGLTRLGGVKEVESTVDLSGYVPYEGMTENLTLGQHYVYFVGKPYGLDDTLYTTFGNGVSMDYKLGSYLNPTGSLQTVKDPNSTTDIKRAYGAIDLCYYTSEKLQNCLGRGVLIPYRLNEDETPSVENGLAVYSQSNVKNGNLVPLQVGEPEYKSDATTKNYVDSVIAVATPDTSGLVPYSGATKNLEIQNHKVIAELSRSKDYYTASLGSSAIQMVQGSNTTAARKTANIGANSISVNNTTTAGDTSSLSFNDSSIVVKRIPNGETSLYGSLELRKVNNATTDGLQVVRATGKLANLRVEEPVDSNDAATKKYVDDGLSKSGIVNYKDQIISSCIGNYINNSQQACVNTFPNGNKFAIINLAFKFSNSYTSGTEFEIMNFPTELIPSKNVVLQLYAGRSIGFAYLRAASKSIIATMPIDVSASTEINLLGYYQIV